MYIVNAESEEPIMLLNRRIGFDKDEGMGIDGAAWQEELMYLDGMGKKRIQVWINSPGGVVLDGYNIYNAIIHSKTKVDTYCMGMAASIAAVIFQAGRERIMTTGGILMYHNPSGSDDTEMLNVFKGSLVDMICSRCGKDKETIGAMLKRTTWINAQTAKDSGMCDTILDGSQFNKKHGNAGTAQGAKALWKETNTVINSILNLNNTDMSDTATSKVIGLSLIANYLGLNTEATENSILNEVRDRINVVTLEKVKADETINKLNTDITNRDKEITELKNQVTAKDAELKTIQDKAAADLLTAQNAAKDAATAAATAKATTMVIDFAKAGRIKNEEAVTAPWIAMATNNFDGAKAMIEALPINRVAAKLDGTIEIVDGVGADGKITAASIMMNIQNRHKTGK